MSRWWWWAATSRFHRSASPVDEASPEPYSCTRWPAPPRFALNLNAVKLEAMEAAASVGTVGVAVAAHASGRVRTREAHPAGKAEMGLGIHANLGAFTAPVASAADTVAQLLDKITDQNVGYMRCLAGKMSAPDPRGIAGETR